jgi:hypothetical protein
MTHPLELSFASRLAALRLDHQPQHETDTLTLAQGVYFSWDAGKGDVTLDVTPETGMLMHMRAAVRSVPDWMSFNIELGDGQLAPGDILGVVAELNGGAGETMPAFIRTSRGGELSDTYLADPLEGSDTRAVRTLLHPVREGEGLAGAPGYHTLVLPLPRRDFTLELRDLRIFVLPASRGVLPASRGLRLEPETLGDSAD